MISPYSLREQRGQKNKWAAEVKQRCGFNKAAVALANKNVRTIFGR